MYAWHPFSAVFCLFLLTDASTNFLLKFWAQSKHACAHDVTCSKKVLQLKKKNTNDFTNVSLATVNKHQVNAHRVILSTWSHFFRNILLRNPHQNPLFFPQKSIIEIQRIGPVVLKSLLFKILTAFWPCLNHFDSVWQHFDSVWHNFDSVWQHLTE